MDAGPDARGHRMPRRSRLSRTRDFKAVYATRQRVFNGPLAVWSAPNGLGYCRLGLAVSRRVGTAVVRSRVKRLLREAFRLLQHDIPPGYDLVINVRPHRLMTLDDYRRMIRKAAGTLDTRWRNRQTPPPPSSPGR